MNIRQPWVDHYEWTDSISDWAEHHALETERRAILTADVSKADKHEGVLYTAPQGRVDQGWPVRRCSPEMATFVDALPEPYDQGERTGRHRERMGILAAWERGLLQPAVRQAVGWFTVMAFVLAAFKYWS